MANRFPLVIDTTNGNKIAEIRVGDNLDLRNVSIVDVQDISSIGTISAPVMKIQDIEIDPGNYLKLSDRDLYAANASKFVKVDSTGNFLEFLGLEDAGILNGELTSNIFPNADGVLNVGTTDRRFSEVHAVNLNGNVKAADDTIAFDFEEGRFYIIENGVPRKLISETKALIYSLIL